MNIQKRTSTREAMRRILVMIREKINPILDAIPSSLVLIEYEAATRPSTIEQCL
jgi:hypothetical protein